MRACVTIMATETIGLPAFAQIGKADLVQTPGGVLIKAKLRELPPGLRDRQVPGERSVQERRWSLCTARA